MSTKPKPTEPPTADPSTPEPVTRGGPGVPGPDPSPEPGTPAAPAGSTRAVKIGGRDFSVPEDLAEVLAQRERDYEAGIQRQGQELGTLRRQVTEQHELLSGLRQAFGPKAPAGPDWNTLVFENPAKALELHRQAIVDEVTARQTAQKELDGFWRSFYKANPDLDEAEDGPLVEFIVTRHASDLAPLSHKDGTAQKKLGELTRRYILRFARKGGADEPEEPTRAIVEGGGQTRTRSAPAEPDGPRSLSAAIKARRDAKLAGAKTPGRKVAARA
jgi:hypothetical protein